MFKRLFTAFAPLFMIAAAADARFAATEGEGEKRSEPLTTAPPRYLRNVPPCNSAKGRGFTKPAVTPRRFASVNGDVGRAWAKRDRKCAARLAQAARTGQPLWRKPAREERSAA